MFSPSERRVKSVPVNVVGSSVFGIFPKISAERTYNMYISDGFLINFMGYEIVSALDSASEGRGVFASFNGRFILFVASGDVYRIDENSFRNDRVVPQFVGSIQSDSGEVTMDENLNKQIAICDPGIAIYIYNYGDGSFTKQNLTAAGVTVSPNYVKYHNSFFLIGASPEGETVGQWFAAQFASATTITIPNENIYGFQQNKADTPLAVVPIPSKGNNVLVLGNISGEIHTLTSSGYRLVQSVSLDLGVASVNTIAFNETFITYLGRNEKNARALIVFNGSEYKEITTDGFTSLLDSVVNIERSTAFMFEESGHLFYQLTFFDPRDNFSIVYDFKTDKFFDVTDEKFDFHPARQAVSLGGSLYFASIRDGSLFKLSQNFGTYKYTFDKDDLGEDIPRRRTTKTIRGGGKIFYGNNIEVLFEQGVLSYFVSSENLSQEQIADFSGNLIVDFNGNQIVSFNHQGGTGETKFPAVDLRISYNGNQSFSNAVRKRLNSRSLFQNRLRWYRLGRGNEMTFQFDFIGFDRSVSGNAMLEIGV